MLKMANLIHKIQIDIIKRHRKMSRDQCSTNIQVSTKKITGVILKKQKQKQNKKTET